MSEVKGSVDEKGPSDGSPGDKIQDKTEKSKYIARTNNFYDTLPDDYDPPVWEPHTDEHYNIDQSVFVVGSRGSGKTTMCLSVLIKLRRLYPFIFAFTKTPHNNFWQQFIPADKVIDCREGIPAEAVKALLESGSARFIRWKAQKVTKGKSSGNPYYLFIWEDAVTENSIRKLGMMERILMNGRHDGMSNWVLSQSFVGMTPRERQNIDRLVLSEIHDAGTRDCLRISHGKNFLRILDRVTSDPFTFIVINQRAGVPPEKRLMKYKADLKYVESIHTKNLHFGNRVFWGDIKLEEQKKLYPYLQKMPALATFEGAFNDKVGEDEQAEVENDEDAGALEDVDPKEGPQIEEKKRKPGEDDWGETDGLGVGLGAAALAGIWWFFF